MLNRIWMPVIVGMSLVGLCYAKEPAGELPGANAVMSFDSRFHPVIALNGMVAAQDRIAAEVGRDILVRGGNAIDAAVATGFALAVTHPQAGNLGGGGFMMVSLPGQDEVIAIDFREMAPAKAARDMYLGPDGEVDNQLAQYSHLSAGVPGTVMGLLEALETYGTMSRRQVISPAIKLAYQGFPVSYGLSASLSANKAVMSTDPSTLDYFFPIDHKAPVPGDILVQKDLAQTLRRIVKDGTDGFYKGKTAKLLLAEIEAGGGIMTQADLDNYKTVIRSAVTGNYNGYEIASMPPPSSGGVHIVQMLNILSGYDLQADGHNSANYLHKLTEAMRRAYADRSKYLGDPDFFDVPVDELIDQTYADYLRTTIDLERASLSSDIGPAQSLPYESNETTHYSVMDKYGNAVSVTYTLNFSYGSGFTVDGAGFLLNNEMDDFSAKPGSPNGYGLIGGIANQIEPGKRPLSSMTPLIMKKDGRAVLATGSPGGSTIITAVLQMVLNVAEFDMNVAQATAAARMHHQWLPDIVITEPGVSQDTLNILASRGFIIPRTDNGDYARTVLGRVNSVAYKDGVFQGAADSRGPKSAAAGY